MVGIVEELLIGADGKNRAAVLRVSNQGRASKHLRRPVQRLYPIEMAVTTTEKNQRNPEQETEYDSDTTPGPNPCQTPVRQQPRQAAALSTRDRLMALALDSDEDDY